MRSFILKLAYHYMRTLGIGFGAAQKMAWTFAKQSWQFVKFTKKDGTETERLVYRVGFNKQAVRGGVRTCPAHYTLHIEVQNGVPTPTDDFNPLTVKWLACTDQMYRPISLRP
jgi:hypothetical protein